MSRSKHQYALWLQESAQGKDQDNQAEASLNYPCRPQQHVHDLNSIAANQVEKKEKQLPLCIIT